MSSVYLYKRGALTTEPKFTRVRLDRRPKRLLVGFEEDERTVDELAGRLG